MADSDRASPSGMHHQGAAQPGPSSPKSLTSSNVPTKNSKGDRPVFTLKQMTMICEKMCKVKKITFPFLMGFVFFFLTMGHMGKKKLKTESRI